jgi:hypothetical protein
MSIFGNIMSSIFGHAKAETAPAAQASGKPSGASTGGHNIQCWISKHR